jgi:clan AA aspartic protease (TIGR02281 family)
VPPEDIQEVPTRGGPHPPTIGRKESGRQERRVEKVAPASKKEVPEKKRQEIPLGWVYILNPWGMEVNKVPSAVVGGQWIALPVKSCIGGDKWLFRPGEPDEAQIEGGIWRDFDGMGLWQLEEGRSFDGPDLHPWNESLPLKWLSIISGEPKRPAKITSYSYEGLFIRCVLDQSFQEPGLLFQGDRIVGWTFGPWHEDGYLWNGPNLEDLVYHIRVDHFYNMTFAYGREEQLSRALAMGSGVLATERLKTFAEAFRLRPELTQDYTPAILRPERIMGQIRQLTQRLVKDGFSEDVVKILDEEVLREASDIHLTMLAIQARAEARGYESAIGFAEEIRGEMKDDGGETFSKFERLHQWLYLQWVGEFLKRGEIERGRQAFRRGTRYLKDDARWNLFGVELALAERNWEEAQRLLNAGSYPEEFTDRVRVLRLRASELKEEAGKIVIRFRPGSKFIPVRARLNDAFQQDFLIDTGASLVTIPTSTVTALGIVIDDSNPRRKVSTAGGVRIAPEVVLSSVEMGGWTVDNVEAWVLDIPEQPGLGLLGLSYLRRFHVELDDKNGVLLLKPR